MLCTSFLGLSFVFYPLLIVPHLEKVVQHKSLIQSVNVFQLLHGCGMIHDESVHFPFEIAYAFVVELAVLFN